MTIESSTPVDTTRVSSLERENSSLKTRIQSLELENQSLESQLTSAQQEAVKVDLSQDALNAQNSNQPSNGEISPETQQFIENKNLDMASESRNFDKQSVLGQAGSFILSQSNALSSTAIRLLS
jgi:predicted RNase H-like nuclease (RuvC/YqgF family)